MHDQLVAPKAAGIDPTPTAGTITVDGVKVGDGLDVR